MSNPKALAEKEKGNAAFKAADYPTAIGHYSAAIVADRSDHTFPLNRAAAYLKLGKYEDAERDCTTVLALSALNAKALFRRGQARVALGKLNEASADLNQASKREPTNAAITEEIKKVEALIEKRKQKAPVKPISVPAAPTSSSTAPKRRRVPIQIIESSPAPPKSESPQKPVESAPKSELPSSSKPAQAQLSEDTFTAVSTRSLNKPSTTQPKPSPSGATSSTQETQKPVASSPPGESPNPTPPPATPASTVPASPQPDQARTFKDAKAARENARPSRVGGGIFRASGQNTIFPTREMTPPGSTPPPKKEAKPKPSSDANASVEGSKPTAFPLSSPGSGRPLTLFDFARSWESKPGPEDRWALITAIPPLKITSLFQTSLETSLLVSILTLFKEVLSATGASSRQGTRIGEYMKSFGEVKRFETVVMFMSKSEKQLAVEIWEQLGVDGGDAGNAWGKIWA